MINNIIFLNDLFRSLGVQGHIDALALMFSAVFRLMLIKHADDLNKSGKSLGQFLFLTWVQKQHIC